MQRREFVTLLGGAAAALPLAARAQQPAMPVIGFLNGASALAYAPMVAAFRKGLEEIGYREGQNVAIEYRWAEGHYEQLSTLAADLVRRRVAVIFANGPAVGPAKAETASIPIVFSAGFDPVASGLVASLNRPGGNVTGASILDVELGTKRVALLHELVPAAGIMALLINPTNPSAEFMTTDHQAAANSLGLQLRILQAGTDRDFDKAFTTLSQLQVGALVIGNDPFFTSRSAELAALALRYGMPAAYNSRQFTFAGGLMSYGGSIIDAYRLAGAYTGRILKGEKAADLPVQQSTKVDFVINLRTAKLFGLTIPMTLQASADEVIE
jgi:putative ABC transport system substrate-binding protein